MSDRGLHTLSPGGPPPPGPPPKGLLGALQSALGCLGTGGVLFFVLIAVIFIESQCASPGPSYRPPPAPPAERTASFYSDASAPTPLLVQLSGADYEVEYVAIDDARARQLLASTDKAFVADFRTGETRGSADGAEVIILVGRPNLHVGAYGAFDRSATEFVVHENRIRRAVFDHATPPTGPPYLALPERRTIHVVGELVNVEMEGFSGSSVNRVRILDLGPSEEEWRQYEERKADHYRRLYEPPPERAGYEHGRTSRRGR